MLISASFRAVDVVNAGFWRLKAPETSIWAPEGAFGPKKAIFEVFFIIFQVFVGGKLPFWALFIGVNLNFQAVIKSAALAADLITA